MSDIAFGQLAQAINQHQGMGLWVVDENIGPEEMALVRPRGSLQAVTNRCDVHHQLQERGFQALLSDFSLSEVGEACEVVFYRVSKEKPIVHHVINQAGQLLNEGGQLLLAGYKNEGIKTYTDKAACYLGSLVSKIKGGKTAMLATLESDGHTGQPLDDQDYKLLRNINEGASPELCSKPGVYGWNKIDKGSALLIDCLASYQSALMDAGFNPDSKVLDLGCGYGYLSVMAASMIAGQFTACDNNIAAVACCRENFASNKVQGDVTNDDCGSAVPAGQYSLVLCNPPFHQGFGVEGDLTTRFLQAARRALAPNGVALFVVNAFIPLERKAAELFSHCELLSDDASFKVLALKP